MHEFGTGLQSLYGCDQWKSGSSQESCFEKGHNIFPLVTLVAWITQFSFKSKLMKGNLSIQIALHILSQLIQKAIYCIWQCFLIHWIYQFQQMSWVKVHVCYSTISVFSITVSLQKTYLEIKVMSGARNWRNAQNSCFRNIKAAILD